MTPETAVVPATTRPRTRRIWALTTMFCVAVVVLAADAISKAQVLAKLPGHPPVRLLDGLITLDLTFNAGAAFGVGTSYTAVIALIVCGVIVYIIRTARRLRSRAWTIALGLLLGGAMGNLGDRLFRAPGLLRGQVVDWINLPHFPWTFNLADASITCAAVIIAILALRGIRIDGTTPAHAARIDPDRPGYEVDGTSDSIETARRHIDSLLARWRTPLQPQAPPSPQAPLHPGPPNGVRVPLTT
jgi:signal peptidase II